MDIGEFVENIPRRGMLIGLIILGILVFVIDTTSHGNRMDIQVDMRFTQFLGLITIVIGALAAGYMSRRCSEMQ